MTRAQKKHLTAILFETENALRRKYIKGQKEHGGNLWEKECLFELGHEITDLIIYYQVVRQKVCRLHTMVYLLQMKIRDVRVKQTKLSMRALEQHAKQMLDLVSNNSKNKYKYK